MAMISREKGVRGSALTTYLKDISSIPLLTPQQEVSLNKRIKEGDGQARKEMIQANLRLVVSIAKDYNNKGIYLEDLIEEGNLGLMEAVKRFDHLKGFRFSTYAKPWIKKFILSKFNENPKHVSLAKLENNEEDKQTEDNVKHDISKPISYFLENEQLQNGLNMLSDLEWNVLSFKKGLDSQEKHTLLETAQYFHITIGKVRQIIAETLEKIKNPKSYQKKALARGLELYGSSKPKYQKKSLRSNSTSTKKLTGTSWPNCPFSIECGLDEHKKPIAVIKILRPVSNKEWRNIWLSVQKWQGYIWPYYPKENEDKKFHKEIINYLSKTR